MAKSNDDDLASRLLDEINGSCKPEVKAAINGNLPPEWVVTSVAAMLTFRQPGIAVIASADEQTNNGWHQVGAKVEIDVPADRLEIADELARQLVMKIKARVPSRVRIALAPGATMPKRGTAGSSGYDLYAPHDIMIRRGAVAVVHSGVHLELPDETWEVQIRGRSSMNKRGLIVLLGTCDADYRGVVGATIINLSQNDETIKAGERFAQMVICRVAHPEIEHVEVDDLMKTERGHNGYGSTGA